MIQISENRGLAFVIMPFADKFKDAYELAIKPSCIENGYRCERLDEQIFYENILTRIYEQIEKADLLIADMSDRNVNVYYEVGYAHGIRRELILLANSSADIPFDLKHYPHIVYDNGLSSLKQQLSRRIKHHNQKLDAQPPVSIHDLDFQLCGHSLNADTIIKVPAGMSNYGAGLLLELKFNVGNPKSLGLDLNGGEISLVVPQQSELGTGAIRKTLARSTVELSDGRIQISNIHPLKMLAPRTQQSFDLDIWLKNRDLDLNESVKFVLKLMLNQDFREIPFEIRFDPLYRLN